MEAQSKDFWTCGILLSKEPYTKLAIQCFICNRLYDTIQDFQKHLTTNNLRENSKTRIDTTTQQEEASSSNKSLYFSEWKSKEQNLEVLDRVENGMNTVTNFLKSKTLYHDYALNDSTRNPAYNIPLRNTDKKQTNNGFLCEKCGLKLKYFHQLQDHMSIIHDKLRLFLCSECPKTYARKTHLNDRIRTHSLQRDYICGTCSKMFRRSQDLTRHKLLHQESKQYKCLYCASTFRQHSGLYKHIRTKHDLEPKGISC